MLQVLKDRPFHYNHWIVILQCWEPVISPLFPSQIPFWIRLHGLPLHYWHEKMIYNLGQDLGTLDDYKITKTSVRIKVSIDTLKPVIKSALVEFDSGEELEVTFDYEELEYHCSSCYSLSHLARSCPSVKENRLTERPPSQELSAPSRHQTTSAQQHKHEDTEDSFKTRIDRHGNPFGERLPLPDARGRPLQSKITPRSTTSRGSPQARPSSSALYRPTTQRNEWRPLPPTHSRTPQTQWREVSQGPWGHTAARNDEQRTPSSASRREMGETPPPPHWNAT